MGDASNALPPFTEDGLLPPGDFVLSLTALADSILVVGPNDRESYPRWDREWRARLVDNLAILVKQLW